MHTITYDLDVINTFGHRLRKARMLRGYTQPEVAQSVGIALRTYQKYEQGTRSPSFDLLADLCRRLEVSSDYLIGLSDENEGSDVEEPREDR